MGKITATYAHIQATK